MSVSRRGACEPWGCHRWPYAGQRTAAPAIDSPSIVAKDSGSHKVQRECETHLTSHHHNSVNTMDLIKNSSDLERVAATEHESDEFFIRSIIVTQKSSIATEITSRLCCTLWDPESSARPAGSAVPLARKKKWMVESRDGGVSRRVSRQR